MITELNKLLIVYYSIPIQHYIFKILSASKKKKLIKIIETCRLKMIKIEYIYDCI